MCVCGSAGVCAVNKKAKEGGEGLRREKGREQAQAQGAPDMETWQCVYAEAAADGDLGSGNLLGS